MKYNLAMTDETRMQAILEANQGRYNAISDRLSESGKLRLVDEVQLREGTEEREAANNLNAVVFRLGSLTEELAFQAAEKSTQNLEYEKALSELELLAEFLAQLSEKNDRMTFMHDTVGNDRYTQEGDNARVWLGSFLHKQQRVDFTIVARERAKEVFSGGRPGQIVESRQPRIAINIQSGKDKVDLRVDPATKALCVDLESDNLQQLDFEGVNQSGGHHFHTNLAFTPRTFANTIKLFSETIDSRVK